MTRLSIARPLARNASLILKRNTKINHNVKSVSFLQQAVTRQQIYSMSFSSASVTYPVPKEEWTKPIKEGASIPSITFKTRVRTGGDEENPFDWKDVTSEDLFAGKRCVLFSLPGAFTPTCSTTHLPGYEEVYDEIKGLGVDEVYCLSVNDAFVMRQWGLNLGLAEDKTPGANGFEKVKLLPDGAAHFTRG